MTKRKPLPYHVSYAIDKALCENSQAVQALLTVMNAQTTTEERYRLIGKAIHHIHESTSALKDARLTPSLEPVE